MTKITNKDLNLCFNKEADRLDFTVHLKDTRGRKFALSGMVFRMYGNDRYYVSSSMLTIDFQPTPNEKIGPNRIKFFEWQRTDGHFTIRGAIKHHLEKVWGVEVTDVIELPSVLPTYVRQEAEKKVVEIAMRERFNGTHDEQMDCAKGFARKVVGDGSCFVPKGCTAPKTVQIALYNFDAWGVFEKWNALYGVKEDISEEENEIGSVVADDEAA